MRAMDENTSISLARLWVRDFVRKRDWEHYHTPRNLAESIVLESAELLELFQWDSTPDKDAITQELSDVIIYCLGLANALEIDISDGVKKKLAKNEERYPASRFKGNWSKPGKEGQTLATDEHTTTRRYAG
jgi:dCTP diphosphatase